METMDLSVHLHGVLLSSSEWLPVWFFQTKMKPASRRSSLSFSFCSGYEVLTRLIGRAESLQKINGIKIARAAPPVTNVLFANDVMLFSRANHIEVSNLNECMLTFAQWSGQVLNPHKSFLHFSHNVRPSLRSQLVEIMRIQAVDDPGPYLGLPLGLPRSKIQFCKDLEEQISSRLQGWKAHSLSQAGRTVLLQSVASAIPSYYMSVFLLPKVVSAY